MKPSYTYTVGAGDVLSISVWGQKENDLQKADVMVPPDGRVTFPLAGTVQASNMTLQELAEALRAKLADHLTAPIVTVSLHESHSHQVIVLGEVPRQGPEPFLDHMNIAQAIGLAGGPTWTYAKTENCAIIRGSLDDPKFIPVDLDDVLDGTEKNVFLQPGDIVIVPAKTVTRFSRYTEQLLSPLRFGTAAGASAATTATTIGTSTLVFPTIGGAP
jgi:polysaccharide export outer membrane protein